MLRVARLQQIVERSPVELQLAPPVPATPAPTVVEIPDPVSVAVVATPTPRSWTMQVFRDQHDLVTHVRLDPDL